MKNSITRPSPRSRVEDYINDRTGTDLSKFFDQYLRTVQIPELEMQWGGGTLLYRWTNCIEDFNMPVLVNTGGEDTWLNPTTEWKELRQVTQSITVSNNFYITTSEVVD
jgi:hypothetical protein